MKYALIIIAAFLLLQSCSDNNGNSKISVKVAFKQSPLDSVYTRLRPNVQSFKIDNSKTTIIQAANGTELLVPANCFVDGNGNVVGGNVEIEIIEAFSLPDFITSGLATVSGDKLLISNGMMYINAKSGDIPVQINKETPLTVSMPTINSNNRFQMFTGDGSNWTVDSSMTKTDYTIPLPLDLLYPDGNKFFWTCEQNWGDKNEKISYLDTNIVSVTDDKYENTVIATEEFKRRHDLLWAMMERMSYFTNRDYYFDKKDCFDQKFNYDLWKVYYESPNRSFKESDSIAKKMYIEYFNVNKDKIAAFCNDVNEHKRKYYSNWTDTNYYFDFRKISLKDDYMKVLEYFPPSDTKEIKIINDHGVNLNAENAYNQLKEKGIDATEINELLAYNFKKQSLIKVLKKNKESLADKKKLDKMYESTVFSLTTMGWINCDRFFDESSAGKAEMYVSNGSGNSLDFIDCSLVIPDMNVRLSAFPTEGDSYSFTQKDGRYTRLPIGKFAVIVGVSIQHDSLFFGSRKINIQDGLKTELPMQYIGKDALKDSLALALK